MDNILKIIGAIVLSVGGIGTIIIGLSSWIAKIWANKFYEKERRKQEEYLKEIQNKFDTKLAELNSQLERNNVQFEILNRERVEVVKSLYTKLVDLQDYFGLYIRDISKKNLGQNSESQSYSNLILSVSEFMDYNNHNRIFFDEKICESLSEIDAIITIVLNLLEKGKKDENREKTHSAFVRFGPLCFPERAGVGLHGGGTV